VSRSCAECQELRVAGRNRSPVRGTIKYAAIAFALYCFCYCSAGQEIYREFVGLIGTKPGPVFSIHSPLLIDTNNTAPKLAQTVLDLKMVKNTGHVGEVGLGMTMEGVVAAWGRPPALYSSCWGGPRFLYTDVNVVFEPSSNCVKRIVFMKKFPTLASGLSPSSTTDEFVRVLGKPTGRKDGADGDMCQLTFSTGGATLKINHLERGLSSIEVDSPVGDLHSQP